MKKYSLHIVVALFFITGFFVRCANPAAPQGGARDTLAPRILSILPLNFTTNFEATTVVITFDEYVTLNNPQDEIVIAPPMKKRPQFKVKGRSVIMTMESKLDSSTTYKIDFGEAIKDNNEGNPLVNFSYVLSTGATIDSLVMTGQLLDSYKGDTIVGGVVYLFDASVDTMSYDSTLFIGAPLSVARTDSNGVFIATNLKDMDYLVYGVADKNGNSTYDVGDEMVAFADSAANPVNLPPLLMWYNKQRNALEATPQLYLNAFPEKAVRRQNLEDMKRVARGKVDFYFTAPGADVRDIVLSDYAASEFATEFNLTKDTLKLWLLKPDSLILDSLNGSISYIGKSLIDEDSIISKRISLFQKNTSQKESQKEAQRESRRENRRDEQRENSSSNSSSNREKNPFAVSVELRGELNPNKDIQFNFDVPMKGDVKRELMTLEREIVVEMSDRERRAMRSQQPVEEEDNAMKFEPVEFDFVQDSLLPRVWQLKSEWVANRNYKLTILEGAFEDVIGNRNDSLASEFKTMNPEKFSILNIETLLPDSSKSYVLEVVTAGVDKVVARVSNLINGVNVVDYIPAGRYKLRIIEDRNENGVWDGGSLIDRVAPEKVELYRDDNRNTIFETKENWEIDLKLDLREF